MPTLTEVQGVFTCNQLQPGEWPISGRLHCVDGLLIQFNSKVMQVKL